MKKAATTKSKKYFKEAITMKKSRTLLALTLAIVLCFANLIPAFAAGNPVEAPDENNPVKAAIAKILQIPVGTNFPAMTFKFEVEPKSLDGDEGATAKMPPVNPKDIVFDGTETNDAVDGIISITKESPEDIFKDVEWKQAGVYIYELTETKNTYTIVDATREYMKYSDAVYTLKVYVKEASTKGTYYIYAIAAGITAPDGDDSADVIGDKVDMTPGNSKMTFTNRYVKTNGPTDPEKPDPVTESTLLVSKAVAGPFSSSTIYFGYKLTINVPSILAAPKAFYKAYVVENGAVVTSVDNGTVAGTDAGGAYISFVSGNEVEFNLKDGQRLVFIDTPIGTIYDVTEKAATAYTPDAYITTNGIGPVKFPGALSTELPVLGQFVGEAANKADFVNTRDEVAPMGVNLNDLPFIGMLLMALLAIAGYIVFKTRRRRAVN